MNKLNPPDSKFDSFSNNQPSKTKIEHNPAAIGEIPKGRQIEAPAFNTNFGLSLNGRFNLLEEDNGDSGADIMPSFSKGLFPGLGKPSKSLESNVNSLDTSNQNLNGPLGRSLED